jgi:immune inhibitor A
VPPSPELLAHLYARFLDLKAQRRLPDALTFEQHFYVWRSSRRGGSVRGLDDGVNDPEAAPIEMISRPSAQLPHEVRTVVLLVDFPDQPHDENHGPTYFHQMLFTVGTFPVGSMRDYYRLVSNFDPEAKTGVDVGGEVFGWFRLPENLSFYTDGSSAMDEDAFPRNGQGMARDAVRAAIEAGVDFSPYDMFGDGKVTALIIIHAGRGAERPPGSRNDIWSHKWDIRTPIVTNGVKVFAYLTVPEDCNMGVCAHEWGHLAAQWADYYDTDKLRLSRSNGLGRYCLMASGVWANHGLTPTLPNGMLRMFQGWVDGQVVQTSTQGIVLHPAAEGGDIAVIHNPERMTEKQYIVVEYRRRSGQDSHLPDEGIAVYVVDESIPDVNDETRMAIELLQADGRRDLAKVLERGNSGDSTDLFPLDNKRTIGKTTKPPLDLPDGVWSGVTITVKGQPGAPTMSIDVKIA